MRRLLSIRDARLFLAGQTLSLFGDSALYLALGIWVKSLTDHGGRGGRLRRLPVPEADGVGLPARQAERRRERRGSDRRARHGCR